MKANNIDVPIKILKEDAQIPKYIHYTDAGCDLFCCDSNINIPVGKIKVVNTGIAIKIPAGFEAQIRPRSGLAIKKGIMVVNSPATIDSGYIGEIKVGLINMGREPVSINHGERFAQLVFSPVYRGIFHEVETLGNTDRDKGGFGHTGV